MIGQARAELFKTASHDDLYARDLLSLCVAALDEHPEVVLAHSWSAVIDGSGAVTNCSSIRWTLLPAGARAVPEHAL